MPMNIADFRAELTRDGARPNLFEVVMPFPAVAFADGGSGRTLTYLCKSAQLPGSDMGIIPVYYFGREIKVPGNRTFADWSISIINDENFKLRNAFERWSNSINSHNLNVRNPAAVSSVGYSTTATVTQFGKAGERLKVYNFLAVWPSSVTQIDLDWGANDQIEEFQVSLPYVLWDDPTNGVI